jgi:hypothetical protein
VPGHRQSVDARPVGRPVLTDMFHDRALLYLDILTWALVLLAVTLGQL